MFKKQIKPDEKIIKKKKKMDDILLLRRLIKRSEYNLESFCFSY